MTIPALTTGEVASRLERADILLTRGRGLVARLIRWATRSYWNHVSVVFVLGDQSSGSVQGYRRTFIIEAESHGIDIHPIDKYLCKERQGLVILSLPDGAVPDSIRPRYLRRCRGFALEEIDVGYGFSAIGGIIRKIFGWIGRPVSALAALSKLLFRTPASAGAVNRWICSGVVQYAFYGSCFGGDPKAGPWEDYFNEASNRAKVVFNTDLRILVEGGLGYEEAVDRLRQTTPAHFALAAVYGGLTVVAERIGGTRGNTLARLMLGQAP